MGFLAPPCSVFFAASLTTISSIPFLIRPPGGLSQYCFISTDENPDTPPKYRIMPSSSSAVCGTFTPLLAAGAAKNAATDLCSSSAIAAFCWAARTQSRHSQPRVPVFPSWTEK